jgi:hypothetical protein
MVLSQAVTILCESSEFTRRGRQALSGPHVPDRTTPRSKEIEMNRNLASTLTITATAAAALAMAAMASSNAYADDITVDNTPFVSSKTRAEVQAEVIGQNMSIASSEWAGQMNEPRQTTSDFTRAQATAEYLAARNEVRALTAEDSGSFSFAASPRRVDGSVIMASESH